MRTPRPVFLTAAGLTFLVVTLGAFVRLSDAGLGCPDWPGCYGHMVVPTGVSQLGADAHARAWIEMTHRYAAGALGVLIFVLAWKHRNDRPLRPLLGSLVVLLIFQALLGMWTVTLKLMPLAVMGHLLGGLAILGLLWWSYLETSSRISALGMAALLFLVLQITLGGWTSANYAAIACPDFPTCQTRWWPPADYYRAFTLPDAMYGSYEGGAHDAPARTAIHMTHRIGAVAALLVIGAFSWTLLRKPGPTRRAGLLLAAALALQLSIGTLNVVLHLPLGIAVAHTAGAALLLLALVGALRAGAKSTGPAAATIRRYG